MIQKYRYSISNKLKKLFKPNHSTLGSGLQRKKAITMAVAIVGMLLISFVTRAQCPTNLVHHFGLDETTSGTYIDQVSPVTASCTNCPSPTGSLFAGAQKFDGRDDGLIIEDVTRFEWEYNVDFTLELWVRVDGNGGKNQVILGRSAEDSRMAWWVGVDPEGFAVFELYDQKRVGFKTEKYGKKINDGQWHHIVAIRNGGLKKNKLYIDGYKVADFAYTYENSFKSRSPVTIGHFRLDNGYHFAGAVDEVMIYNKALNEVEVRSRYNYGSAAYCGPENLPPVIRSEPVKFGVATQPYYYDVQAIGVPNPVYTLTKAPEGMRINENTGEIAWTPKAAGTYGVTVKVENSVGQDQQIYTINVKNDIGTIKGLRHHWMLHETSGTSYKDYYTPYDAICEPAAKPSPIPGVIAGGQRFDGVNTGLSVSNSENFNWKPDENFSIELWMRTTASTAGNRVLIGRDAKDSDMHWWIGADTRGYATFQLRDYMWDGITVGGNGPQLTDGKWHHIVAVRDAGTGSNKLYVDGQKIAEGSFTYRYGFQSLAQVNIGYMNREGGYRFEGDMDEVMLFGRALTDAEILERYNALYDAIVELVRFEGHLSYNTVILNWTTQTELELSEFIVERSEDGQSFTEIGRVQASGTSTVALDYTYVDETPVQGTSYYRLKIVKQSGVSTYSNVVTIEYGAPLTKSFFVYPNPVQGNEVTIEVTNLTPDQKVVFMLSDMSGKKHLQEELVVESSGALNHIVAVPAHLNAGIYILSIVTDKQSISRKLVVLD